MAVRLRLKRVGRRNLPVYRLLAVDGRVRRDGRPIEELGHYDPLIDDVAKAVSLNRERVEYWLSVGAQPSETVASILRKAGITTAKKNPKS